MSSPASRPVQVGRVARGFAATIALCALALAALFVLTFSCCSSPDIGERIGNPFFWCTLLAMPVPLAAFPPLSRRLRGHPVRWALVPSVLVALLFPIGAAIALLESAEASAIAYAFALVGSTSLCAVYVGWRVILAPARAEEAKPARDAR